MKYSYADDNSNHVVLIYRGSYMIAHVLLNLLNELGKRDKMRGLCLTWPQGYKTFFMLSTTESISKYRVVGY